MISPTMWQKLNGASLSRKCQKGMVYIYRGVPQPCAKHAEFRTRINEDGEEGMKDLTEYTYMCTEHTYL